MALICGVNPLLLVITVSVATSKDDLMVVELVVNGHCTMPDAVSSCSSWAETVVDLDPVPSFDVVSLGG